MNQSCDYKKILTDSIMRTLEEIAFIQLIEIQTETLDTTSPDYMQDMLSVYMPVKAKYGILIMSASSEILEETACNIFALEPGTRPGPEMINDTLSELLNTISGQFMRAITPVNEFYELGLPVTGNFDLKTIEGEAVNCAFENENGAKLLISYIKISK